MGLQFERTSTVALKSLSRPYAAPLQHHGPLPPINGRLGGMGDMGWLGGCNHKDTSAFQFFIQSFLICWKMGKYFSVRCDQCGTRKYLSILGSDWLRIWQWKSTSLCHTVFVCSRPKYFFDFLTCWKSSNEEVKYSCVCVIASTPVSPLHPFRPVAHLWGEVDHGAAVAPPMGEKVSWAQLCVHDFSISVMPLFPQTSPVVCCNLEYFLCWCLYMWDNIQYFYFIFYIFKFSLYDRTAVVFKVNERLGDILQILTEPEQRGAGAPGAGQMVVTRIKMALLDREDILKLGLVGQCHFRSVLNISQYQSINHSNVKSYVYCLLWKKNYNLLPRSFLFLYSLHWLFNYVPVFLLFLNLKISKKLLQIHLSHSRKFLIILCTMRKCWLKQ